MRTAEKFIRSRTRPLSRLEIQALEHSARTAVAAGLAVLAARLFKLPEAYWAAVTTLSVTQSNLKATWSVSLRRWAGTALGVAVGALLATYFGPSVLAFGAGVFLLGVLCALLSLTNRRLTEYLDTTAYGYASMALAIVMLIVRYNSAWIVALHRFTEVSIGIAVGLVLTMLWPERQVRTAA